MEGSQQNNILDSYESTENALMDSFKAAALKVTTLYKDSLVQNRKAFASGYQQALQDLYEFISTQPENGFIPVQDVLAFARQKNNQLTAEMGIPSHTTTSNATSLNNNMMNPPSRPNNQEQLQKLNTANPFQIDPHSQFTFTHDIPRTMDGLWDQAATTAVNDGFKRRMIPNELSFMGRSVNMESWHEPPFKRGRLRRDEQQLTQQQQQQQQQQQSQQQFLQQGQPPI
ncbi:uncharacterized protein BX663DRAFT_514169 [Cokeromyces recurvatus]|uniref:uncharacterized protein n=1 Tax=Cokeromyces recurvatus TaxID=90255 RepID=UPI002220523B|nr:uncharacterized protein BX663DRAFT_514169 [Cokeromyces recurvatus]KAI7901344.1 hypothetical protein BX663DRAFT_514169 [Cokeromyces recurvatus]